MNVTMLHTYNRPPNLFIAGHNYDLAKSALERIEADFKMKKIPGPYFREVVEESVNPLDQQIRDLTDDIAVRSAVFEKLKTESVTHLEAFTALAEEDDSPAAVRIRLQYTKTDAALKLHEASLALLCMDLEELKKQKAELRTQEPEAGSQNMEAGSQEPEAKTQEPEDADNTQKQDDPDNTGKKGSQKSERRTQNPGAGNKKPAANKPKTDKK